VDEFAPAVRWHGPTGNSRPDHIGTVTIEFEDEDGPRRVDVLFHEGRFTRLRVHEPDVVIEEAFLRGSRPDNIAIIGVRPRSSVEPRTVTAP
jgi:hypothetical protein